MTDRYAIIIPYDGDAVLLHCNDGDGLRLETLQGLVEGCIEAVVTALAANWSGEKDIDDIVLICNEEGKLLKLDPNENATALCLLDEHDYIAGDAVLLAKRGDELIGFRKDAAEKIIKLWKLTDGI